MIWKWTVYDALGPAPSTRVGKTVSVLLTTLISLNIVALVVETIQEVHDLFPSIFSAFEIVSVVIFTVEYLLRVWSCTADPNFSRSVLGRFKLIVSPLMLIDLLAVLPFYVALFSPSVLDLRVMRAVRLIARIGHLAHYFSGLRILARVLKAKSNQLVGVVIVLLVLLLLTSSLVFFVENGSQPDKYSSIPETMWWGIITLTTVGYGDTYPVTMVGRLLTGLTAILGIGLFALPAGILGSGFIQETERKVEPITVCPHCGGQIQ